MFVLLEHTGHGNVHWDFMIEVPGSGLLPTWRLARDPLVHPGEISAERVADHQPHFLEYEGRLSGSLGSVRRVDRGEALVERFGARALVAELRGARLRGRVTITPDADGSTRFCGPGTPEDADSAAAPM